MAELSQHSGDRRLNSWKEIAAFFGKDERTVKRWETSRGMPVRRVPGGQRTSVFAYAGELEAWLKRGRGEEAAAPAPAAPRAAAPAYRDAGERPFDWRQWRGFAAATLLGVLVAIFVSFQGAPERGASGPAGEARDLYLSGIYQLSTRTSAGLHRAVADFSAAIEIDPGHAASHAGLASAYNLLSQYTMMPAEEAYPKARVSAERALALDPGLAAAHAAMAFNDFYWKRDFARAAEGFERAIALDPQSGQIHHWYALAAMHLGDFGRPVELITRAQELDPASRSTLANKALILFHAGRADEALEILASLRQDHPDFLATPSYLATIHLALGDYPSFLREYGEAARVQRNAARVSIAAAARLGYAQGGDRGMLEAMMAAQERAYANGAEPAYKLAATAALLELAPQALAWLDIAVERNETDVLGMRIEPAFRSLHGDPGFAGLLARIGLPAP